MMVYRISLVWLLGLLLAAAQPDGAAERVPLEGRWHDVYFGNAPKSLLLDPQRLLHGSEARDAREFLDYYASDSQINLRVLLFRGNQELVRSSTATSLHQGWPRSDKPEVVLYYYMGAPSRAELHLSDELEAVVPEMERARTLESCVERANTAVTSPEALEKFMVQLSIRADRMVRLLNEGTASPAPLLLAEPSEQDAIEAEDSALWQRAKGIWDEWGMVMIGAVLAFLFIAVGRLVYLKRATCSFPDHAARERLGAAHGAGVGGVIAFSKSSPPAASQREKLKEH